MSVLGMQPDVMAKLILGVSILGGALMCFFGIRLFKIVLGLAGFVVGATVAAYFAVKFTSAAGAGPPPGWPVPGLPVRWRGARPPRPESCR